VTDPVLSSAHVEAVTGPEGREPPCWRAPWATAAREERQRAHAEPDSSDVDADRHRKESNHEGKWQRSGKTVKGMVTKRENRMFLSENETFSPSCAHA